MRHVNQKALIVEDCGDGTGIFSVKRIKFASALGGNCHTSHEVRLDHGPLQEMLVTAEAHSKRRGWPWGIRRKFNLETESGGVTSSRRL